MSLEDIIKEVRAKDWLTLKAAQEGFRSTRAQWIAEEMRDWCADQLESYAAAERQFREKLEALRNKLELDSLEWDNKNEDRPLQSAQGSTDYVYGYNAGVSEGFRAAHGRIEVLLDGR